MNIHAPYEMTGLDSRRAAYATVDAMDHGPCDFPNAAVAALSETGLLLAPFPAALGGAGLGSADPLMLLDVLAILGASSLPVGRLYEGHVNAILLVARYGTRANLELLRAEAAAGRLTGVWMAEADDPLRIAPDGRLTGRKILCSGAGHIRRPLIAAGRPMDGSLMVLPKVDDEDRVDLSAWRPLGMASTATGTVDFTGLSIAADEVVGQGDDYLRSPVFRGGAWRVLAVQRGALDRLLALFREQIAASGRPADALLRARFGEACAMVETARLWVHEACLRAEGDTDDSPAIEAYVDLARNAFEQVALKTIALVQKGIGLKAFIEPNPIERVVRDLTTYLRQPGLDLSLDSAAAFHLERPRGDGSRRP